MKDFGIDTNVLSIRFAVMSSAFANASALYTNQSGTNVGTAPHEKLQALSGFVFFKVEAATLQAFTSSHLTMKEGRRLCLWTNVQVRFPPPVWLPSTGRGQEMRV